MKKLTSFLVSFALSIGPAVAKEVDVRSGEHPEFTRLVLKIDPSSKWHLEEGSKSARLFIQEKEIQFRVDNVFDRIPRSRLASLKQEKTGAPLEMSFACDCQAKAFVEQGTLLVIDIAERSGDLQEKFKLPILSHPNPSIAGTQLALRPVVEAPTSFDPQILPARQVDSSTGQGTAQLAFPSISEEIETRLINRIQRGIEQEVLEPDLLLPEDQTGNQTNVAPKSQRGSVQLSNFLVTTVVDRDVAKSNVSSKSQSVTPKCVPPEELTVGEWGTETEFGRQIGSTRDQLYGEFDELDEAGVIRLARLYIHFGFGAEARSVLSLLDGTKRDLSILNAMAKALEGKAPDKYGPLSGQLACPGETALWSLLSSQKIPSDFDAGQIERAFSKLPKHLRDYLGPRIAKHFADAGDIETAGQILRILERSGDEEKDAAIMVEAQMAEVMNDPELQEEKLLNVVENDQMTEHAAYALIELVEKRWRDGGSISDSELQLVAANAHEFRNGDEAQQFQLAYLLALSLGGQHQNALSGLLEAKPDTRNEAWASTFDRTTGLLVRNADDITFLRYMFALNSEPLNALTSDTAVVIAQRLLELGFSEAALRFLDRPGDRHTRKERADLIAEATLLNGRPHRALLELQGEDAERANKLRARALEQTGSLEDAADILASIGELEDAHRLKWLADVIDDPHVPTETEFSKVSTLTRTIEAELVHPTTPIAEARSLVKASVDARAAIEALLDYTN